MHEVVRLLELPHREARRLLSRGEPIVYLGVNPVEFHGPHLSLHNDRLISEGLSRDLHAALCRRRGDAPFIVASELELGCEPASGPGSRHARLSTLRDAVGEAVRALAELGARHNDEAVRSLLQRHGITYTVTPPAAPAAAVRKP